MIVLADRITSSTWQTYCGYCGAPLDIISSEEMAWINVFQVTYLCMACDEESENVPDFFLPVDSPGFVRVDDLIFELSLPVELPIRDKKTRSYACLVSQISKNPVEELYTEVLQDILGGAA